MAPLVGFDPSAAAKLASGAWAIYDRLMRTPEGRELISKEMEIMRREAQEKGETTCH